MIYVQRSSWWWYWPLLPLRDCSLPFHKGHVQNNKWILNEYGPRGQVAGGAWVCDIVVVVVIPPPTPIFPTKLYHVEINRPQLILFLNYQGDNFEDIGGKGH